MLLILAGASGHTQCLGVDSDFSILHIRGGRLNFTEREPHFLHHKSPEYLVPTTVTEEKLEG